MWLVEMGKNIRRCRKAANLQSKYVAEKAGITAGQLSRIENGKVTDIMTSTIKGIIDAIGCPATEIFGQREMTIQQAFAVIDKLKPPQKTSKND